MYAIKFQNTDETHAAVFNLHNRMPVYIKRHHKEYKKTDTIYVENEDAAFLRCEGYKCTPLKRKLFFHELVLVKKAWASGCISVERFYKCGSFI